MFPSPPGWQLLSQRPLPILQGPCGCTTVLERVRRPAAPLRPPWKEAETQRGRLIAQTTQPAAGRAGPGDLEIQSPAPSSRHWLNREQKLGIRRGRAPLGPREQLFAASQGAGASDMSPVASCLGERQPGEAASKPIRFLPCSLSCFPGMSSLPALCPSLPTPPYKYLSGLCPLLYSCSRHSPCLSPWPGPHSVQCS